MTIGIIGTAGRSKENPLTLENYEKMIEKAKEFINEKVQDIDEVCFISGGAAWSDHIAVELYLDKDFLKEKRKNIHLYFPCEWDEKQKMFLDNGKFSFKENPGKTANYYHQKFSKIIGKNSFLELDQIQKFSSQVVFGFFERNTEIAKNSEILIAFSQSDQLSPGTLDTWNKSTSNQKFIINI